MINRISGGCLCGTVRFSLNEQYQAFFICHCEQCKKITGSGFAANIFTDVNNIEWVSGQDAITSYHHPDRDFSKSFCKKCGSGVPHINQSNTALLIPAGSLSGNPTITPQANLFIGEQAHWLIDGLQSKQYKGFAK